MSDRYCGPHFQSTFIFIVNFHAEIFFLCSVGIDDHHRLVPILIKPDFAATPVVVGADVTAYIEISIIHKFDPTRTLGATTQPSSTLSVAQWAPHDGPRWKDASSRRANRATQAPKVSQCRTPTAYGTFQQFREYNGTRRVSGLRGLPKGRTRSNGLSISLPKQLVVNQA